jgi:hypothetical protein
MKAIIFSAALLLGVTITAGAQSISVNFVGTAGDNGTLAPTDFAGNPNEGAFVQNWVNAVGTSGTLINLPTSLGSLTPATVTWQAGNGGWQLPNTVDGANLSGGANPVMMKGYLDSFSDATPTVLTFTGLPTAGLLYDVLVYFDGDNGGSWRVGEFTLSGALSGNGSAFGEDSEGVNFNSGTGNNPDGLFQLPVAGPNGNQLWPISPNNSEGNYVRFSGVSGSSFIITGDPGPAATGTLRAAINGIQIVGVPEPSTVVLFGLGGTGLLLGFLRRR